MNREQVAVIKPDGTPHDYRLSLNKILGLEGSKKVVDIVGYIVGYTTTEWDTPTFQITSIVLDDGSTLGVGGEHDLPYIKDGFVSEEIMEQINELG